MKCFRLTDSYFACLSDIWEARGAFETGGRWNLPGTRAIYLSDNPEVCCSEKGFYSIITKAEAYKLRREAPKDNKLSLIDHKLTLVELDIMIDSSNFLDFTDQKELNSYLAKASLPAKTVQDSRLSPYFYLEKRWTQELGRYCESSGIKGLKVKSARSDQGCNFIIFPTNNEIKYVDRTSSETVLLSAVDTKKTDKFAMGSDRPSMNEIWVERQGQGSKMSVLNFPISE